VREAGLNFAKAGLGLARSEGSTTSSALVTLDSASYRLEETGKKVVALMPSTGEAESRFVTSVQAIRSAASEENYTRMRGAEAEDTASWKALYSACEEAVGGSATTTTTTTTTTPVASYSPTDQASFRHACTAFGADAGACICALKKVEATVPAEKLAEDEAALLEETNPQRFTTPLAVIIQHCFVQQAKEAGAG